MTARFIVADVLDGLATLKDGSIDLVLSSPPFLALRSYLPADHPDKAREIGSEATPGEYLDVLLDVVEGCTRVLAPHGTLAFELGDTYAGGGNGPDKRNPGADHEANAQTRWRSPDTPRVNRGGRTTTSADMAGRGENIGGHHMGGPGWPMDKSLCMIPEMFAFALAYGRNPFTGRETPRWRVRNVVAWCRPNPPVGALGDKFRPATSYLTIACKARDRWFDLDAVREESVRGPRPNELEGRGHERKGGDPPHTRVSRMKSHPEFNGAPPLDWWEIPTQPYKGAHYATWPEKLCARPIDAMCAREVCTVCGEPRRRIVATERVTDGNYVAAHLEVERATGGPYASNGDTERTTLGWTDCGHGDFRRGIVLDPFAGSGTTLAVAEGLGRDSVGIDLDERNADLARERCGMFVTVEEHE